MKNIRAKSFEPKTRPAPALSDEDRELLELGRAFQKIIKSGQLKDSLKEIVEVELAKIKGKVI
jgi:hypothetical protein